MIPSGESGRLARKEAVESPWVVGGGAMLPEAAGTGPEAAEAVPGEGVAGDEETIPDGPVGDVAVAPPPAAPTPAEAVAAGWVETLGLAGVCPPLEAVPPAAAEAAGPEELDDPPTAAVLPLAGAVPEGRTAALGPTFTATSSSLVVPRRRSCRWKRRMKSP